jgi:preprotein translocase subunit SecE
VSGVRASLPVLEETEMKKLRLLTNIEESYAELRYKTSWPTGKQLIKSAIIVLVASIIIALIIFLMDRVVDSLMHLIYSFGR